MSPRAGRCARKTPHRSFSECRPPGRHDRRALARRPAVEAAVSAGADGRPAASLGKPAYGRLPTGLPQRLGRRSAPPTATWKTLRVSHSSHSLDDDDRLLSYRWKGGTGLRPVPAQRGHHVKRDPYPAEIAQVSTIVGIGVHDRRSPHRAGALVADVERLTEAPLDAPQGTRQRYRPTAHREVEVVAQEGPCEHDEPVPFLHLADQPQKPSRLPLFLEQPLPRGRCGCTRGTPHLRRTPSASAASLVPGPQPTAMTDGRTWHWSCAGIECATREWDSLTTRPR